MRLKKILNIMFFITIIVSGLLVGTPIKNNIMIVNLLLNITAIIYIIKDNIIENKKIKLSKIDILVIIICLSNFIPLITNSYIRLIDTTEYILRYISVLNVYFLTKKITKEDKNLSILINIFIVISVIMIFFGIDIMTYNIGEEFYSFLGTPKVDIDNKIRMVSLYKYANTFAILLTATLIMSLEKYIETENKNKKSIYGISIFLHIFAIIMTYSRLTWIITAIMLVVYVILKKEKRKQALQIIFIALLNAMVYYFVFTNSITDGKLYLIPIILFVQTILELVIIKIISIIKFKKIVYATLIIIAIGIVCNTFMMSGDLKLFNNENAKKSIRKQNIKVETNSNYTLEVDLEAKTQVANSFSIVVKQLDEKENNIEEHEIFFGNFEGTQKLEFKTQQYTKNISIIFKGIEVDNNTELKIKNVRLNGKEIRVNYGIIPIEFINRLTKIEIDTSSVLDRIDYYKEALKISKDNLLFGQGGNVWKYKKSSNISGISEHSYILQLLLQNGIIAVVSYCILIFILVKHLYKYLKNGNMHLDIILALFAIIIHSIFDFDLSFLYILMLTYMLIAILDKKIINEQKIPINKIVTYIIICFLAVTLYFNFGEVATSYIDTDNITDTNKKMRMIDLKIILSPHDYRYYEDKANLISTLKNKGVFEEDSEEYKNATREIIKNIEFVTEIEKLQEPYQYNKIILNKIDLITEENKEETLKEIEEIVKEKIGYNEDINEGINSRLQKRLNKLNMEK